MYKLGTLEQFIQDENKAKKTAGWTQDEIDNGKPTPDGEGGTYLKTNLLSKNRNPNNSNEYLWESASGDIEDSFNILAIWNKGISPSSLSKPRGTKYCIYNNDGAYAACVIGEDSSLNFGSNVTDIEIFDIESDYLARVQELNIEIEEV